MEIHILQKHIQSTTKLQSIVKSMKTLSAVNIRQYEKAVKSLGNYLRTIELGLQVVLKDHAIPSPASGSKTSSPRRGLVIFGSDQGLCGRFNKKLVEFVIEDCRNQQLEKSTLRLLVIGGRLGERLETAGFIIDEYFETPNSIHSINKNVFQILLALENRQSGHIDLFFNQHAAGSGGRPYRRTLLPLDNRHLQHIKKRSWHGHSLPTFAIPPSRLFTGLIRQYLFVSLFRAQTESLESEQASRLLSLQNAEKNIQDHLEELKADFRIKRQTAITSELLDIVAGFKAAAGTH